MDNHSGNTGLDLSTSPSSVEINLVCEDGHNRTGSFADHIPEIFIDSITLLICLCGLFGNGSILWLLGFCIKRNPSTPYFLNLAIADSLFLIRTSVFLIIYHAPLFRRLQPKLLRVLLLFQSMVLLTHSTSLYLLTAISLERCLCVLWPFSYQCHHLGLLSVVMCCLLWTLACVLSVLVSFVCDVARCEHCWMVLTIFCFLSSCLFTPFMVLSNVILLIKLKLDGSRKDRSLIHTTILLLVSFFPFPTADFGYWILLRLFDFSGFGFDTSLSLACMNSSSNLVI
uniref:G-protein coupled receptors family 1 profile domain-containing protein n=1 Tax=Nothoprocta perdicaria TaxID=30464 RepID=A0A8C6YW00_NOTPE